LLLPPEAGVLSLGSAGATLDPGAVDAFLADALRQADFDGRRVCVLVPDASRHCPLPVLLDGVHRALAHRVAALDVVVALGTHPPLGPARLAALVGCPEGGISQRYPGMTVANHAWWDPASFVDLGVVEAETLHRLSGGLLDVPVPVRVNRAVADHDVTLIVGPVLPHEVVGFSGGNKYLFPGVSGQELIDVSHWLGALITIPEIIGTLGITPVRALIDTAAALVPSSRLCLAMVVEEGTDRLHSVHFGSPESAWAAAAQVAAQAHVRYLDAPVTRVLSLLSARYDDLWTGAKGIYKVQPVVADGGEIVLYAPGLHEISGTHGAAIARVGYHCRDYFTKQWDRFGTEAWGVLAHSTHVRGTGTFDPVGGEHNRIRITLATGIPAAETRGVGLGYLDPASVDVTAWARDPHTLVVPDAGEVLYRLRQAG